MKASLICFIVALILSVSNCNKEDCHRTLTIVNKSDSKIIYSTILYDGADISKCILTKDAILETNESYHEELRMCWEDELLNRDFVFYIRESNNNNNVTEFHDCDSIIYLYDILKEYVITSKDIDNLKRNNFTIEYE